MPKLEQQSVFTVFTHPRNNRFRLMITGILAVLIIAAILLIAYTTPPEALKPVNGQRNLPPSWDHLLGTDWLGRDLAGRVFVGMRLSLWLGLISSFGSMVIALLVALAAGLGPAWLDRAMSWLIDATLGLPQIVFALLVSFALGGGAVGVTVAIAVTQWPPLARLLRAEIFTVRSEPYVEYSRARGMPPAAIASNHIIPAVVPHLIVGFLIAFPHAIVHESMLTFLGYGIDPTTPSLGIVLSEGLRYLTNGQWWAVLGPIAVLVVLATVLDRCGDLTRRLLVPETRHE